MSRIETGRAQFEGDWPGIFIRGDNALFYGLTLQKLLKTINEDASEEFRSKAGIDALLLDGLQETLMSCHIEAPDITQKLKPFNECVLSLPPEDETPVSPV